MTTLLEALAGGLLEEGSDSDVESVVVVSILQSSESLL